MGRGMCRELNYMLVSFNSRQAVRSFAQCPKKKKNEFC
jgi:hypothetical protein